MRRAGRGASRRRAPAAARSFALCALAALAAAGLAAAAPTPPEWAVAAKARYWDNSRSVLELGTIAPNQGADCTWPGGVYVLNESNTDYKNGACTSQDGVYLWTKKCSPNQQSVAFRKRVYLPGRPISVEGSLVSLRNRPMRSMAIEINGSPMLQSRTSVRKRAGRTTVFKLGWNEIVIRATKPKTGPCNKSTPDTGIYAALRAQFGADVQASTPPPEPKTGSAVIQIPITITNKGPSAAMTTGVSFATKTSKLRTNAPGSNIAIVLTVAGSTLPGCSYFRTEGYSTTCDLGLLEAGQSVTVTAIYTYLAPAGNFSDQYAISWGGGASGMYDPNPQNNGGTRTQYVCSPGPCTP